MIDLTLIRTSIPALLHGAVVSLQIAALSSALGITLGTILGVMQSTKKQVLGWLITVYISLMRGTPMLIQITFAVYVLPELGIRIAPFWATILAIGLNSAAYMSQIIRSGIKAVGRGQIEAAKTLGLSPWQYTRYIILPQAFTAVFPALGNEFITLIKDSSLASIVGVAELAREGSLIRSRTFDAFSIYTAVALLYLCMTTTLSIVLHALEKRFTRHANH